MLRLAVVLLLASSCASPKPAAKKDAAPAMKAPPPPTAPPQRVAFLQLKPSGPSSEQLAETMGQLVAFDLEETGRFQVLSRDDLTQALKLKGIQQGLGCDTDNCQADLARAADVQQLVTGSLGKLGDKFVLVLRLVDSKDVRVVRQARDYAAGREEDLMAAAQRTSWTIAGIEVEKKPEEPAPQNGASDDASDGSSDAANGVLATGASDIFRGAFGGLTRGARVAAPGSMGLVDAVLPHLTADLEKSLATSLAARLNERQRQKQKAPAAK